MVPPIPSVVVTDIIASTGMAVQCKSTPGTRANSGDFKQEHARRIMIITDESHNVSPVMRVGGINESDILKALDIGIH